MILVKKEMKKAWVRSLAREIPFNMLGGIKFRYCLNSCIKGHFYSIYIVYSFHEFSNYFQYDAHDGNNEHGASSSYDGY